MADCVGWERPVVEQAVVVAVGPPNIVEVGPPEGADIVVDSLHFEHRIVAVELGWGPSQFQFGNNQN